MLSLIFSVNFKLLWEGKWRFRFIYINENNREKSDKRPLSFALFRRVESALVFYSSLLWFLVFLTKYNIFIRQLKQQEKINKSSSTSVLLRRVERCAVPFIFTLKFSVSIKVLPESSILICQRKQQEQKVTKAIHQLRHFVMLRVPWCLVHIYLNFWCLLQVALKRKVEFSFYIH